MLLAPWFLAGLLAIGVPLWLHRIARRERIKVPFASLMLLAASEVRDTSRRHLRYWFLLAVRIALLVLLALAFAQPLFNANSAALNASTAQLHAIVLDTSLSMQYGDHWQRATQQARSLINNLKGGDRALLVAASGRKIEHESEGYDLPAAPPVPTTSIYSRTDGVVAWQASVQAPWPANPQTENIEVLASHIGLGLNPSAWWAVADRLAQAENNWQPFSRQDKGRIHGLIYPEPQRDI